METRPVNGFSVFAVGFFQRFLSFRCWSTVSQFSIIFRCWSKSMLNERNPFFELWSRPPTNAGTGCLNAVVVWMAQNSPEISYTSFSKERKNYMHNVCEIRHRSALHFCCRFTNTLQYCLMFKPRRKPDAERSLQRLFMYEVMKEGKCSPLPTTK